MKPVINLEEKIGKTVGRRRIINPLRTRPSDIADAMEWRRAFGGVKVPRGVFKFHSHEEADAWLMRHGVIGDGAEDSHPGCLGTRASSLRSGSHAGFAGRMHASRFRLEA